MPQTMSLSVRPSRNSPRALTALPLPTRHHAADQAFFLAAAFLATGALTVTATFGAITDEL
jgi:hypothetical protein